VPRHPHVTFIEGDVCDERLVDRLLSKARYVIHAAAKNIIISTRNTYDDYETNIGGTLKMLLAARRHGIRRFVYTSSSSVYGNSSELPIAEDSSLYTLSPYSVSKLAGENYCTAFYESYGLPCVMLRYSNVYGVNQDPRNPYCGVVSRFFESALAGRPLELHGDGEQTRDFTYVDDTASATVAALLSARAEGQVLNVGTGTETSVNTLARKVLEVTGTTVPIVYKDFSETADGSSANRTRPTGLGDIDLGVRVFLLSHKDFDRNSWHRFGVSLGSSLPTGRNDAQRNGLRLDEHAQLGTGAFIPYAGLIYSFSRDPWNFFATVHAKTPLENGYAYRYGSAVHDCGRKRAADTPRRDRLGRPGSRGRRERLPGRCPLIP